MKRVRGGSGLGDAIYVRVVADALVAQGHAVVACSNYREVFIGCQAEVQPFRRDNIDVVAHYTAGKSIDGTTQWQDVCRSAGIEAELRLKWETKNQELVREVQSLANGRPIVVVHGGRAPMGRVDGFGAELLPDQAAFDAVLRRLKDCFLVKIGKGIEAYPLKVGLDLSGRTSVADLFDVVKASSGVVGQCSFVAPMAEGLGKPLLVVWANKGLTAREGYVRLITPKKILEKMTSSFVIDDWSEEKMKEAVSAFRALF